MKIIHQKRYDIILILGICTGLFLYVILRAYYISFTHDESLSYTLIKGNPAFTYTPNNHILNTYLMGVSSKLFGDSELALRLPNVLSFGLYLLGCFLILKKSKNRWFIILGSGLLLFNPILIEFFSLARGYGLSLGFMMMSLFFLLRRNFNYSSYQSLITDFIFSMIFALLALYANLNTINYCIAILAIFILQYLFLVIKNPAKSLIIHLVYIVVVLMTTIPLYFAVKRLLHLDELGELWFGENTLVGTIDSLVYYSLYFSVYPSWVFVLIKYAVITSLPLGILSMLVKRSFSWNFLKITSLIIIMLTGLIIEHTLFHSIYPTGRHALILIPIFGLFIYYLLDHIRQFFKPQKQSFFSVILCAFVFFPLFFHFLFNLNLKSTKTWYKDPYIKDAMKIIEEYTHNEDRNMTISNNWIFEPAINYYIDSRKMKLDSANRNGVDSTTDFVYEFSDSCNLRNFETLIQYDDIGTSLLIKK